MLFHLVQSIRSDLPFQYSYCRLSSGLPCLRNGWQNRQILPHNPWHHWLLFLTRIYRTMSFETTPLFNTPSTLMRISLGLLCNKHCEAKTISTSLVPIPNAIAPNAPCVEVWLSPQTIVIPG